MSTFTVCITAVMSLVWFVEVANVLESSRISRVLVEQSSPVPDVVWKGLSFEQSI